MLSKDGPKNVPNKEGLRVTDHEYADESSNIEWTDEIHKETALRKMEVLMYPFKEVAMGILLS